MLPLIRFVSVERRGKAVAGRQPLFTPPSQPLRKPSRVVVASFSPLSNPLIVTLDVPPAANQISKIV